MKQFRTPCRLKVYSRWREIVDISIGARRWTERRADGRLVHHVGRLLPAQEPGTILDEPKPCTWCKKPAIIATAKGRAYHPACPGVHWTDALPDDQVARIVFGAARDLGAVVIEEIEHEDPVTGTVTRCDRPCCVPRPRPVAWTWRIGRR